MIKALLFEANSKGRLFLAQEYGNFDTLRHITLPASSEYDSNDTEAMAAMVRYVHENLMENIDSICAYVRGPMSSGDVIACVIIGAKSNTRAQGKYLFGRTTANPLYVFRASGNSYSYQQIVLTSSADVGSSSTPIYLNNGVPTACGDIGSWQSITFTQSSDSAISSVTLQGRYNSALKIGYVDCNVTIASSVSSGWHTIATMNIKPLIASTVIIPVSGGSVTGNFQIGDSGTVEINVGTNAGGANFRYAIMFPYG